MARAPRSRCCSCTGRAYDDWTFPKGKVDPGESDEDCAVREVEEETGLRCVLGRELPSTAYDDAKGRPEGGALLGDGRSPAATLRFEHEVDEARWVDGLAEAAELLSYERDVALLRRWRSGVRLTRTRRVGARRLPGAPASAPGAR